MNLLLSSEINSLGIGYATETWTEYNDLLRFYRKIVCGVAEFVLRACRTVTFFVAGK